MTNDDDKRSGSWLPGVLSYFANFVLETSFFFQVRYFIKINSNILKAARDFLLPHFWNTHSKTWKEVLKFSEFQMVSVVTEPIA